MKFTITVELLQGDVPVTPKDLKAFGTINFVKAAPKAFKRAMKATCWPFNANVTVSLVDNPPKKKGKNVSRKKKN
jgi:hypothetical protein